MELLRARERRTTSGCCRPRIVPNPDLQSRPAVTAGVGAHGHRDTRGWPTASIVPGGATLRAFEGVAVEALARASSAARVCVSGLASMLDKRNKTYLNLREGAENQVLPRGRGRGRRMTPTTANHQACTRRSDYPGAQRALPPLPHRRMSAGINRTLRTGHRHAVMDLDGRPIHQSRADRRALEVSVQDVAAALRSAMPPRLVDVRTPEGGAGADRGRCSSLSWRRDDAGPRHGHRLLTSESGPRRRLVFTGTASATRSMTAASTPGPGGPAVPCGMARPQGRAVLRRSVRSYQAAGCQIGRGVAAAIGWHDGAGHLHAEPIPKDGPDVSARFDVRRTPALRS
jgi:hypothetical protein